MSAVDMNAQDRVVVHNVQASKCVPGVRGALDADVSAFGEEGSVTLFPENFDADGLESNVYATWLLRDSLLRDSRFYSIDWRFQGFRPWQLEEIEQAVVAAADELGIV